MTIWQQLEKQKNLKTLSEMFAGDPQRLDKFSLEASHIFYDYSKQRITEEILELLIKLAEEKNLQTKIDDLFAGKHVNKTENRPALHTELRKPKPREEVAAVIDKMSDFVANLDNITDVISLGIGGSDLGPQLVCEALQPYRKNNINLHFIANCDDVTLKSTTKKISPKTTICLINSKSFTTIETLSNAEQLKKIIPMENFYAITAKPEKAKEFGIIPESIFEFWDWVGGRYSVWSAVGLPIAIVCGMDVFERFLDGAHEMDQHFQTAEFSNNMPVIMALIGIWNINFNNYNSLAIMPYVDRLQLLPSYLQQLEMESNGKHAEQQTAPVIWGGVGCNGQHAYMQLLHQGTQVIPVDFIVDASNNQLLTASCLGQSRALMQGENSSEKYKSCPGNRPSSILLFEQLTPEAIGSLIALYEHKVYVQGVIWGIESFDQWGVQLGKNLIAELQEVFYSKNIENIDNSIKGLIEKCLRRDT